MIYFVLTSKKGKAILTSKEADKECFSFIMKHSDAKIRSMDFNASPRVMDKRLFITKFHKATKDENSTFMLAEKLISGKNNLMPLIFMLGLKEQYEAYKEVTSKNL